MHLRDLLAEAQRLRQPPGAAGGAHARVGRQRGLSQARELPSSEAYRGKYDGLLYNNSRDVLACILIPGC